MIGHEDNRSCAWLSTNRKNRESTPKEGMCRVGYLDLIRDLLRWVVERGTISPSIKCWSL